MRFAAACVTVMVLAGIAVFSWQRSQIVSLRALVARQGDALEDLSLRVSASGRAFTTAFQPTGGTPQARAIRDLSDSSAEMRADERAIIVREYRDGLDQMDLSPGTAARLLDLLTDRVETVLDAQDAAVREGFAEGSAQTALAVRLAVAEVDRDIVGLVGQDGIQRIDGLAGAPPGAPAAAPSPAPPVLVTVVVQAPAAPYYPDNADSGTQPPSAEVGTQYVSYPYPYFPLYPMTAVLNEHRGPRRFADPRNGDEPRRRKSVRFDYR